MILKAIYFKYGSSKTYDVDVKSTGQQILILIIESGEELRFNVSDCVAPSVLAGVPIEIKLPDGSCLEVENNPSSIKVITQLGLLKAYSPFFIENKIKYFAIAFILSIFILFCTFKFIIPSASREIAKLVPIKLTNFLDNKITNQLDLVLFDKSNLDNTIKEQVLKLFKKYNIDDVNVNFRKGNRASANAFALAGKQIFFTDEIIKLMNNDKYILAIAFHEAGHINERHLLSTMVKDSFIFLVTLAYLGDLPGAADNMMQFGALLYSHSHSRDFEREADRYAITKLKENNISPLCFVEAMDKLHDHYNTRLHNAVETIVDKDKGDQSFENKNSTETLFDQKLKTLGEFLQNNLSTHPSLKERTMNIVKEYPEAQPCEGRILFSEKEI